MAAWAFIALSIAGGFGAMCRMMLDGIITSRAASAVPWGTILINLTGSLALGVITGLTTHSVLPEAWHAIAGGGFLGGYTTFSTASVETVRLLQQRRLLIAAANGFAVLVTTTCAAAFGLWLASLP